MAGVKRGDVILAFNGIAVGRSSELPPLVGSTVPGSHANLTVFREGREINLPIGPLLRAVRPPRDLRVALLGISVEPTSSTGAPDGSLATIKLSAESASGAEMTRYVRYLVQQPLVRAYLVNHVVDETDSAYPYRFNVEVSWRE